MTWQPFRGELVRLKGGPAVYVVTDDSKRKVGMYVIAPYEFVDVETTRLAVVSLQQLEPHRTADAFGLPPLHPIADVPAPDGYRTGFTVYPQPVATWVVCNGGSIKPGYLYGDERGGFDSLIRYAGRKDFRRLNWMYVKRTLERAAETSRFRVEVSEQNLTRELAR